MKSPFILTVIVLVILSLALAACGGSSTSNSASPTATTASMSQGDAAAGQQAYSQSPCTTCHGANAEGNRGPRLAGIPFSFDNFQKIVRNGREEMPSIGTDQVSDQQLKDIYAWLTSLK